MSAELFDLSDFEPEPVYDGPVPSGFVRDFYSSSELTNAESVTGPHGWRRWFHAVDVPDNRGPSGCELWEFTADLRCSIHDGHGGRMFWRQPCPMHLHNAGFNDDADQERCQCVGELVHMCVCDPCGWNAMGEAGDARRAWLDHAWPGWRNLPIIPAELTPPFGGALIPKNGSPNRGDVKAGRLAHEWATEHFPPEWQVTGAPAIAYARPERHGMRGVIERYAPFGGFLVYEKENREQLEADA